MHAFDVTAIDVPGRGEGLAQPGRAGRAETRIGIVVDALDREVHDGVAKDVVVRPNVPALGVLASTRGVPDLAVQRTHAQFLRHDVIGGNLVDVVVGQGTRIVTGHQSAGIAQWRTTVVERTAGACGGAVVIGADE